MVEPHHPKKSQLLGLGYNWVVGIVSNMHGLRPRLGLRDSEEVGKWGGDN